MIGLYAMSANAELMNTFISNINEARADVEFQIFP